MIEFADKKFFQNQLPLMCIQEHAQNVDCLVLFMPGGAEWRIFQ
jgi:hypothetical protein